MNNTSKVRIKFGEFSRRFRNPYICIDVRLNNPFRSSFRFDVELLALTEVGRN